MIKIENTEVVGWKAAIRGMRNPMNSWDKSDSCTEFDTLYCFDYCDGHHAKDKECPVHCTNNENSIYIGPFSQNGLYLGPNDLGLMKKLVASGTDHRKFMRMIVVYADVTAPLYWWKEYDTYKVGTVANSCSTMHKIADKEFTLDDFSHEHLVNRDDGTKMSYSMINGEVAINDCRPIDVLQLTCNMLNFYREAYLRISEQLRNDMESNEMHRLQKLQKESWWQLIQLLPSSYNQKRTIEVNYEVLANIWKSRKDHKLDEWNHAFSGSFCNWIANLPYSELITRTDDTITKYCTEDIKIIDDLYAHAKSLGEGAIPKEISKKSERGLRQLIKRNSNDVKEEK